jgi:hypothetical protein
MSREEWASAKEDLAKVLEERADYEQSLSCGDGVRSAQRDAAALRKQAEELRSKSN